MKSSPDDTVHVKKLGLMQYTSFSKYIVVMHLPVM